MLVIRFAVVTWCFLFLFAECFSIEIRYVRSDEDALRMIAEELAGTQVRDGRSGLTGLRLCINSGCTNDYGQPTRLRRRQAYNYRITRFTSAYSIVLARGCHDSDSDSDGLRRDGVLRNARSHGMTPLAKRNIATICPRLLSTFPPGVLYPPLV